MDNDINLLASENHCFIICPYCNTEMDYGKINSNMHRGEKDVVPCLVCKKYFTLTSIGGGLNVNKM